jgi:CheY-specific phosphatase CheX
LVGLFGFEIKKRGVSLRHIPQGDEQEAIVVNLKMQFESASGITAYVAKLIQEIESLIAGKLKLPLSEIKIDVGARPVLQVKGDS